MAASIRAQTTGVPAWTAAAGVQAFDPIARVLYINMTTGAADWLAVDVSAFADANAFDDLRKKFIELIGILNGNDIDGISDTFPQEVEASENIDLDEDDDENVLIEGD